MASNSWYYFMLGFAWTNSFVYPLLRHQNFRESLLKGLMLDISRGIGMK
jgi:hypothetical protein